jgi:hypothetical protein
MILLPSCMHIATLVPASLPAYYPFLQIHAMLLNLLVSKRASQYTHSLIKHLLQFFTIRTARA